MVRTTSLPFPPSAFCAKALTRAAAPPSADDCWQAEERVNGHVVAHPENFPSGIKALAAYAHGKGLKLGLYTVRISLRVCCTAA